MLSTASKIKAARVLYRLLKLAGFKDEQCVTRAGIRYQLDLREGIDLSLFLFGGFQNQVATVSPGVGKPVIFDVGANIGAITLAFAQKNPRALIHSFEPTHYAMEKLRRNLTLNPDLAGRVTLCPLFVGSSSGAAGETHAYASWRVDEPAIDAHPTHQGTKMPSTAALTTLDDYVASQQIPHVHLIKIDTDGHELDVLCGARQLMAGSRPRIVMEMCPYLLNERKLTLNDYRDALGAGYELRKLRGGGRFDEQAMERVPKNGGVDILAEPI